ncbi:hypothetical protein BO86DRAFT_354471 [Aspergillus japonicus CBS 114.51]|uniref:DSC E3 ubiquitin ligase complex subunit C n=1 Tax=Aspergillus japonicus CBS 114.51 TaxID=1448312 RepID=A0A8T8XEC4_ASPJA|nr:hypothetical protein BO86DRAFT_354471 [Aspergillus japonicus CBS 114.51]RAH85699.1 hypothetical protein BO86DRAFT_354471 [Aspergillus japonicus CBS 114.51]
MQSSVTSSATLLSLLRQSSSRRTAQTCRLFSSYGNSQRSSSKRELQTATAYRPHSLPTSFPPPRSPGSSDTSIAADFPSFREMTSPQLPGQQAYSPNINLNEAESQKPKPVETSPATTAKPVEKPRRKLRARKAAMKLTPVAIEQLRKLLSQPEPKLIRVGVKNRGCSGLAYHLEYVEKPGTFDEVVEQDGVKVLIDSKALFSIIGSEMDWQEDKLSRKFVFRNPNISKHNLKSTMPTPTLLTPDRMLDLNDSTSTPLYVIIRFSASIPDLPLDIFSPETTTSAGLKQLIRTRLPPNLSSHRLRLIYAGRGLEDATPLAASLKLPPSSSARSTPRPPEDDESTTTSKGKGKAPVRDPPRLYIHCSIGDIVLSAGDLAAEAAIASTIRQPQDSDSGDEDGNDGSPTGSRRNRHQGSSSSALDSAGGTTTPAPRGFDRLLAAGFTPAEVTALRSQFMAIQAVSRTPDTMPSGAELREMEDRWMDEGSSAMAAGGGATGGGGAGGGGEGISFADDDGGFGPGSRGAMDDMLWGAVMGFFWPVGCAMWLRREEGVWSWRKGFAVFVGVVVNVAFGAMRIMN